MAQSGTPVIEPLEKDSEHTLVTFLWRGSPETHNVVVFGSCTTKPMTEYMTAQLGGSDVWCLTLRLPSDARFAYSLLPNDPLSDGPQGAQRLATRQSDPLIHIAGNATPAPLDTSASPRSNSPAPRRSRGSFGARRRPPAKLTNIGSRASC
jgi:uncharacterized protein DUF3327